LTDHPRSINTNIKLQIIPLKSHMKRQIRYLITWQFLMSGIRWNDWYPILRDRSTAVWRK